MAAFIPAPLPPTPALELGPLEGRLRAAEHALARLELAGEMVPSIDWFLYAFVRKEAVLSSQIEGTQATLVDLLTFEAEPVETATPDVEEVCNYLAAITFARGELRSETGLPLSMRLLTETHRRLMSGVRGAEKSPGKVRTSQNWIGGTRPGNAAYAPPPPHALGDVLGAFERYVHADDELPKLVRAGMLHAQFETIHPYLDGNGRIGRLLVTLLLEHWQLMSLGMRHDRLDGPPLGAAAKRLLKIDARVISRCYMTRTHGFRPFGYGCRAGGDCGRAGGDSRRTCLHLW